MRTRRSYRPGHDFRPAAEILQPRIAPSDIALIMYLGTDTGTTTTGDPGTGPECPIYTGPEGTAPTDGTAPSTQTGTQTTAPASS